MDSTEWESTVPQLTEEVKASSRSNGNSTVEAVKVFKTIYPNGIAGKEQDALSMQKIVDVMFQISNAPPGASKELWKSLCAYSLSGLKASS